MVALLTVAAMAAGDNLNGIYLGTDVSGFRPANIAVQITDEGIVIAFIGAEVPGRRDRYGKPVVVRQVKTVDVRDARDAR
jgi:hypothetical protein